MNQGVKQKWLVALRSDEYKQGKYCLRNEKDEYCCLGVLCDVYRKETGIGEWILTPFSSKYRFLGAAGSLPSTLLEWSGIVGANVENSEYTLVQANDRGDTFTKIADLIENNF